MKNESQMNERDDEVFAPTAEPELVKPADALDETNDHEDEDIEGDETEDDDERSGAL